MSADKKTDQEVIGLLIAISEVAKRLARKLAKLAQEEGGKTDESDERNGLGHQGFARCCIFY